MILLNEEQFQDLINNHQQIEIPVELDGAIKQENQRGKEEKDQKRMWRRGLIFAVTSIAVFTITLNAVPSIAHSLQEVPLIGSLVKVLYVERGEVSGGVITDCSNIHLFQWRATDNGEEQFIINFAQQGKEQLHANNFHIQYNQYPKTLTITINGAREFAAAKQLEEITEQSHFIEKAYPVVIGSDSSYRFVLQLKEEVAIEVQELQDPGQVLIQMNEGKVVPQQEILYSARSGSMEMGEQISLIMEMSTNKERTRVLRDEEGKYIVELGQYKDVEQAKNAIEEMEQREIGEVRWEIQEIKI